MTKNRRNPTAKDNDLPAERNYRHGPKLFNSGIGGSFILNFLAQINNEAIMGTIAIKRNTIIKPEYLSPNPSQITRIGKIKRNKIS